MGKPIETPPGAWVQRVEQGCGKLDTVVRSLAAAVLACALTDLLRGRDTAEVLSWIQGRPAALPFWMACQWLDISPLETRQRLREMGSRPFCLPGS